MTDLNSRWLEGAGLQGGAEGWGLKLEAGEEEVGEEAGLLMEAELLE